MGAKKRGLKGPRRPAVDPVDSESFLVRHSEISDLNHRVWAKRNTKKGLPRPSTTFHLDLGDNVLCACRVCGVEVRFSK